MSFYRRLAPLFLAAALGLPLSAGAAEDGRHGKPTDPRLLDYSLLRPAHLPQLMWALKGRGSDLGLDEAQTKSLAAAVLEVRAALVPRLEQARALEQEIARAALDGRSRQELAESLDRLQRLKREAADIHIDSIHRLRAALSSEQFARLVGIAQPQ